MSVLVKLIAAAVLIYASDGISDNKYEYLIFNESKTFEQCNISCANSTVMIIENEGTEKILKATIFSHNVTEIYLGMTRSKNAAFLWLDGTSVKDSYSNWCLEEPKNQTSCGVWFVKNNCWKGDDCDELRSCVCQVLSDRQANQSITDFQSTTTVNSTAMSSSVIFPETTSSLTSAAELADSSTLKTKISKETTFSMVSNSSVTSSTFLVSASGTSSLSLPVTSPTKATAFLVTTRLLVTSSTSFFPESSTESTSLTATPEKIDCNECVSETFARRTIVMSIILGILNLVGIAVITYLAVNLRKTRKELRKLQSREDSSKNTAKPQAQAIQSDLLVVHDISTELETSAGGYLVLDMNPEEPQTSRNFASNSAVNGDFKNTVVQELHDDNHVLPDIDVAAEQPKINNNYVNVVQKQEREKVIDCNYENIAPDEYVLPDEEITNHNYVNIVVKSEENPYEHTNTK